MIRTLVGRAVPVVAILALALRAAPAGAQLVDEEGVGRLTIGAGLGVQLTSMSDVNQNIDVVNTFLSRSDVRGLNHVNAGVLTQADIRYRLGKSPNEDDPTAPVSFLKRLELGFSWGGINARSEFDVSWAAARFYSRATMYYPYLLYHLRFIEPIVPRAQVYVGGGPVFLRKGTVDWHLHDFTTNNFLQDGDLAELSGEGKATGSGTGFAFMTGGSFQLNHRFSVALDMGYRRAKLGNIKLQEAVGDTERFGGTDTGNGQNIVREPGDWAVIDFFLRNPGGEFEGRKRTDPVDQGGCAGCPLYFKGGPMEIDYSGFFTNLSFRVHF